MARINGNSIYAFLQTIAGLSGFTIKVVAPNLYTKLKTLKDFWEKDFIRYESVILAKMQMDPESYHTTVYDLGKVPKHDKTTFLFEMMNKLLILQISKPAPAKPGEEVFNSLPYK